MLAQLSPERVRGVLIRASGLATLVLLAGPPALRAQSATQAAVVRVEVVAPAAVSDVAVTRAPPAASAGAPVDARSAARGRTGAGLRAASAGVVALEVGAALPARAPWRVTTAVGALVEVVVEGVVVAAWDAPCSLSARVPLPVEHAAGSDDVVIRIET